MLKNFKKILVVGFMSLVSGSVLANPTPGPIKIVAAENFYGQLAKEIGGNYVAVQSIIDNPNADPHLFATTPSTSKSLSEARVIIYNGADYDSWIKQMLSGVNPKQVTIINVADLVGVKSGDNPHLWYKPETFPKLAQFLAKQIEELNPGSKATVNANFKLFLSTNHKVEQAISEVKSKCRGTKVTATEPVFGYMADAMGLTMQGLDFQWKIMNDTEPTPKMIADYQQLLSNKQVKVLFYNNQVSDSITKNMQDLAKQNQIPVIGVSETMPNGLSLNNWLLDEVSRTKTALGQCK